MTISCAKTPVSVALVTVLAGPAAFGQAMYRCNGSAGAYLSDRPCGGTTSRSELRAIGPVPDRTNYIPNYAPTMAKAPDILPYLSPECAQMNDAVRTGPTRGLRGESMSELASNYRLRCAEDEQQAH